MIFGVQVESVMDKMRDDIPVDIIARLVYDLHEDSASTLESISSAHQRLLMASLRGRDFVRLRQQQNLVNRRGAIDLGMSRKRPNHQSTRGNAALNLLGSVPKLIRSGKLIGSGAKRVELNVGDSARGDAPLAEAANALKPLPKGRNAVVKKSAVDEPASPSRVPSLFLSDKQDPVPTPKKNSFGPSRRWSQHDDGDLADLTLEEEPAHATDAVESSMTEAVTSNYSFNMFTAYLCDSISPTNDVSVLLDGEDAERRHRRSSGSDQRRRELTVRRVRHLRREGYDRVGAGREDVRAAAHRSALLGDGASHLRLFVFPQAVRHGVRDRRHPVFDPEPHRQAIGTG